MFVAWLSYQQFSWRSVALMYKMWSDRIDNTTGNYTGSNSTTIGNSCPSSIGPWIRPPAVAGTAAATRAPVAVAAATAAAAETIVADYCAASWTPRPGLGSVHGGGNHQLHLRRQSRD